MFKSTIAALVATTMLSSVAHASACADVEVTSRFNPTTLSERQICVLDNYHADKSFGRIGSFIWAKLSDGSYTSVTTSSIAKNAVHGKVGDFVKNEILKAESQIWLDAKLAEVDNYDERIRAAKAKVEAERKAVLAGLNANVDANEAEIAELNGDIVELQELIVEFEAADIESDELISSLNAKIAVKDARIAELSNNLNIELAAIVTHLDRIQDLEGQLATKQNRINELDGFLSDATTATADLQIEFNETAMERDELRVTLAAESALLMTANEDLAAKTAELTAVYEGIAGYGGFEAIDGISVRNQWYDINYPIAVEALEEARTEVTRLEGLLAISAPALVAAEAEVIRLQAIVDAGTSSAADIATIAELRGNLVEAQAEVMSLTNDLAITQEALTNAQDEVADWITHSNTQHGTIAARDATIDGLRVDLAASAAAVAQDLVGNTLALAISEFQTGTSLTHTFDSVLTSITAELGIHSYNNVAGDAGDDGLSWANFTGYQTVLDLETEKAALDAEVASGDYSSYFDGSSVALNNALSDINNIAQEAYDAGYGAGFNDGYEEGYFDGFRDGVASASN